MKNNLYFILADSKTKVGKLFWKNIGQSSGNMRMSKPEHLEQYLQTKQGHLNPFSLANDKEDKVKKIIIDENLKKYTHLGVHPLENDATVEILLEDLNEKILKPTGKEIVLLNLVDEGIKLENRRIGKAEGCRRVKIARAIRIRRFCLIVSNYHQKS
jgi:prolyl-tRNA synthetase